MKQEISFEKCGSCLGSEQAHIKELQHRINDEKDVAKIAESRAKRLHHSQKIMRKGSFCVYPKVLRKMMIHIVKPGDTVYTIARQHGIPPSRLIAENALANPDALAVGQALVVLSVAESYLVRPGDTIASIARDTGTTPISLVGLNPSLLVTPPTEGDILVIAYDTEKIGRLGVNGFYYPTIDDALLRRALPYLSAASVFSYEGKADGTLQEPRGNIPNLSALFTIENGSDAYGMGNAQMQNLNGEGGMPPTVDGDEDTIALPAPQHLMTVTTIGESGGFSSETARSILENRALWSVLGENVNEAVGRYGYNGVVIDFEYIPQDLRDAYTAFVSEMNAQIAVPVIVALAPKVRDDQEGLLYEAHDYQGLGEAADFVILMTYEWGYTYGPPRAVAPLDQVRRVAEYAISRIPAEKILLGIPNYGYRWTLPYISGESRARSLSNPAAVMLAVENGAAIQYDETAAAPFFRYRADNVENEVWFEDARSIRAKLALANELGLRGVSYWTLMRPFEQNWLLLASEYEITPWP